MTFAEALKKGREQLKLTQNELAVKIGINHATVNRWEVGHYAPNNLSRRVLIDLFKENNVDDEIIEALKQR